MSQRKNIKAQVVAFLNSANSRIVFRAEKAAGGFYAAARLTALAGEQQVGRIEEH
jgi:hypothetical protein